MCMIGCFRRLVYRFHFQRYDQAKVQVGEVLVLFHEVYILRASRSICFMWDDLLVLPTRSKSIFTTRPVIAFTKLAREQTRFLCVRTLLEPA